MRNGLSGGVKQGGKTVKAAKGNRKADYHLISEERCGASREI